MMVPGTAASVVRRGGLVDRSSAYQKLRLRTRRAEARRAGGGCRRQHRVRPLLVHSGRFRVCRGRPEQWRRGRRRTGTTATDG